MRSNAIHRRVQATAEQDEASSTGGEQKSKVIVPLPYQATRHSSKNLIDNKNHLANDQRLKAIILHKAAAAYFCLVDRSEKEKNYGSCLRYLRLALNCYSGELKLQSMDHNNSSTECKKLLSYIMSIAGDCRLMIAHITSPEEVEKYREQYHMMSEVDLEIQKVIDEVGINAENSGNCLL